ncbi:DUF4097 family beta strand repeat-containing protein [Lacisediminihabitans sp.]|jgi:DUF4097 and DUF4098 domain-containing protein YvlB|uniref:DUF4097 family beta strand repeat-containing protein n=1 Tax=Lacisediminihabitans sp. TaxID=2787631 RepID=UPI002F93489B
MALEKWLVDGEKVIDIELVRNLKVALIAGQVNIVGHDEPGARVEVHSVHGKSLKVSIDGDTLEIDHPQLSWDNFIDVFKSFRGSASADVSIMVPRDAALKFGVVSASALISGLTADARISTISGEVVVDNHRGDLELNAVSGELAVRNHSGKIAAHTVSGDVTATGEIVRFTCDGVSGNVFLDIAGTPDEVRINSVSGDVTTRLEAGVAAQYRINTVSGKLQLDDASITGVRGSYTGKYGVLEKSWLDFKANTVSGDVSVLHAVTA